MAVRVPVPLTGGLGVRETAARLAALRDALTTLIAATATRLTEDPRFEVKAALAAHLHDDARSLAKLDRRVSELSEVPPSAAVQPDPGAVAAAARELLAAIDPVVDDASLRLLVQLAHRQERHLAELDPRLPPPPEPPLPLPEAAAEKIAAAEEAARRLAAKPTDVGAARAAADLMRHALILDRGASESALEHIRADERRL
jgi:hypothetical protein